MYARLAVGAYICLLGSDEVIRLRVLCFVWEQHLSLKA